VREKKPVVNVIGVNQQRNSSLTVLCSCVTPVHHNYGKKFQSHSMVPLTELKSIPIQCAGNTEEFKQEVKTINKYVSLLCIQCTVLKKKCTVGAYTTVTVINLCLFQYFF